MHITLGIFLQWNCQAKISSIRDSDKPRLVFSYLYSIFFFYLGEFGRKKFCFLGPETRLFETRNDVNNLILRLAETAGEFVLSMKCDYVTIKFHTLTRLNTE